MIDRKYSAINRVAALMTVKRRLKNAGISTICSNHSFRGAGITNFLENGGNLEVAQRIHPIHHDHELQEDFPLRAPTAVPYTTSIL